MSGIEVIFKTLQLVRSDKNKKIQKKKIQKENTEIK